ncbi:MAG: helix-turn-helix transcriptional regulator [Cocleimonas sp.]|nr:helix-turn-helix transcriptional regulator [Cocleimonas sp.]
MPNIQKSLLSFFLITMSLYGAYEIHSELNGFINNKVSVFHVSMEILVIILSLSGLIYFMYLINIQNQLKNSLENNLVKVKQDLKGTHIELTKGKQEYQQVIQSQFAEWQLSPSEKKVALSILKGLSLKEISELRSTHEKTVRKQASAIYEKSRLGGRHELSAWFFEDMYDV